MGLWVKVQTWVTCFSLDQKLVESDGTCHSEDEKNNCVRAQMLELLVNKRPQASKS